MYRRPAQPAFIEEDYDHEELGDVVETDEPVVGEEAKQQPVRHLNESNFDKISEVLFDIDCAASPEELASKIKSAEWKLQAHVTKQLKDNIATTNRKNANDDERVGNLRYCIPLGFEVVMHQNTHKYPMVVVCDAMMNKNVYKHGSGLWRMPPETPAQMVNQKVFEPVSVIDHFVFKKGRMVTLQDLEDDIKIVPGSKGRSGYGTVAVNSLAYDQLLDELDHGAWTNEPLSEEQLRDIDHPGHKRTVEVTAQMAKDIKEQLAGPVRELQARCIDLENMSFRVQRADGQQVFNSPEGLHGELVGSDLDVDHKLPNKALNTRQNVYVKCRLQYKLLE